MLKILRKIFPQKEPETLCCGAILVAAGSAARMEGQDKILYPLGGIPVIVHSLRPFQEAALVTEIVVVTRRDIIMEVGALCKEYGLTKVKTIIPGGGTRTESVQIGLGELSREVSLVAIHDGARPFVPREVVMEAIARAAITGAAAPGIPVKDTIKITAGGAVRETLDRSALVAIQTPQVFELSLIKAALSKAVADGAVLTDDCGAVERLGFPVAVTAGSEENIKLTTPSDLVLGEAILGRRAWP